MKNAILNYELSYWSRSPMPYLLVGCFFLFSFVTMIGTAGYFDGPVEFSEKTSLLNTPYQLCSIGFLFAKFSLFLVAVFAGLGLYRDYRYHVHAILYTFPISKAQYLNGKLASALTIILLSGTAIFSGVLLGEFLVGTENPKIGPFSPMAYLAAWGVYLIPTLLAIGSAVFAVVGFTRNIYAGFMTVICFVLFQFVLENALFNHPDMLAILDPFGQFAFFSATEHWGFEMKNSSLLPINGLVVTNRIFWLAIAFLLYFIFYKKFDFQYHKITGIKFKDNKKEAIFFKKTNPPSGNKEAINFDFSFLGKTASLFQLVLYDFKSILKNWSFLSLCAFGGLAVFFLQLKICNKGEFNLFSRTKIFLGAPLSIYSLIIIFGTFLFSGLLVHKASLSKMNHLVDVTPIKNWQLIYSKIGAITLAQIVQLLVFMAIGISIQLYNGYYHFEMGLYIFHLFVLVLPVLFVWNIVGVFAHSLLPNLLIGLFLLACLWLGAQSLEQVGIETYLLKFNTLPQLDYSDFNGYGFQLRGYFTVMFYWLAVGFFLLSSTMLVWNRGSSTHWRERWKLSRSRLDKKLSATLALSILVFCWLGCGIYQAEQQDKKDSAFFSVNDNSILKEYKSAWDKYAHLKTPKIIDLQLNVDLFPKKREFEASGKYKLINDGNEPIDTIIVRTGFDEITELKWDTTADLILENKEMKSYLFILKKPLAVGDTVGLFFKVKNTPNTVFTKNSNILWDGTYIIQDFLPRLGYQFISHELPLTDSTVQRYNYFHRDADLLNIHTNISTAAGQLAIAPGQLINKASKNGRNHYEFKTPHPVKFNFSFHSAAFELLKEKHQGVDIELYHSKGHQQNVVWMMDGIKAALDFNTQRFGPYPYEQVRVMEFPHTERGYSATLTANNIPTSETLFDINTTAMADKINLPFYVMAHELTHEWFGNQVMPADAEGAKMLTESITEYLTLLIYRNHFGEGMAAKFLELQNKRYQQGKKAERGKEAPLYKVKADQEYLAYGKGAIALYEISQNIGEERMEAILNEYLDQFRSRTKIYPTTTDLLLIFKAHTSRAEFGLVEKWLTTDNVPNQ